VKSLLIDLHKLIIYLQNPKAFLLDLLEYIKANNPLNNILDEKRVNSFIMVLNALNNLILNNPGKYRFQFICIL
jgi:hypothetical protein